MVRSGRGREDGTDRAGGGAGGGRSRAPAGRRRVGGAAAPRAPEAVARPGGLLRLYVDKPGGVGIADCERLSREIGDVLDAAAVIEGGYDLEVSSPGLDRQLRKEREYRWAVGRQVRCWLAGGAEVRGRL